MDLQYNIKTYYVKPKVSISAPLSGLSVPTDQVRKVLEILCTDKAVGPLVTHHLDSLQLGY